MSPFITIVVPVYKVKDYIEDTIRSIINQEYHDFELVVVDDGSPDDSAIIAETILQQSNMAYSIIHTENRGVSAARNTGIENAKGQFIVMVDADDVLTPDFLSMYVALIQDYPCSNIYSTSFTVYKGGSIIEQPKQETPVVQYGAEDAQCAFYHRSPRFLLPTLMYSKEFLNHHGIRFDETVRFSEDVQFIWHTLALNDKPIIHSSASGYHYILHEGSTMTASGVQKILTGCKGIIKLDKDIHPYLSPSIQDTFVSMWYFSMLHGSAKMLPYSLFDELYKESGSDQYLKVIENCSSGKTKWTSSILRKFRFVGYQIMKKF